jgi:hypothetical protein
MCAPDNESSFDGERAKQYVREIAFPRMVGTEGERKAAETIAGILKELGYQVRQEEFSIRVPAWVWMKGFLLVSLCLLVLTQWTFDRSRCLALMRGILIFWIVSWEGFWLRLVDGAVSEVPAKEHIREMLPRTPNAEVGSLFTWLLIMTAKVNL